MSKHRAKPIRVEWHVYVEPWPTDRWRATTMMAVDEAHAHVLARGRKYARIKKVVLWSTEEVLWDGPGEPR